MSEWTRRLPAEWEKHQATLLAFPHDGRDWPGKYGAIQWAFVEIIRKVALYEPVLLVVKSPAHRDRVAAMLMQAHADAENIRYIILNTNRSWMRDSGPVVVQRSDGTREALQFRFNGWAKYPNYRLDEKIPAAVAGFLKIPLTQARHKGKPVVLEGGAIDVNGVRHADHDRRMSLGCQDPGAQSGVLQGRLRDSSSRNTSASPT